MSATPEAPHTTLAEQLRSTLETLSHERQQEVLDFAKFPAERQEPKKPRKSSRGALSHLEFDVTVQDIRGIRQEMWANFPREDLL